jgi:methionyl-tRNA formyltransferase
LLKIIYISGVQFGYELLSSLLEHEKSISLIISYEDQKKKNYSDFANFNEISKKYNVLHKQVDKINDKKNVELIRSLQPDLIFVMGWSQLLSDELIDIPKIGIIGSHPTELPKYRGRAPIPWTILKNLTQSALTFFWINPGTDEGPIENQKFFKIDQSDDASSIYKKIIDIGKNMILEDLELIESGELRKIPQDQTKFIENWPKRQPDDGKINWSKSSSDIHRLIRASTHPYPGAFTYFGKKKIKIWKATISSDKSNGIGRIMEITDDKIKVGTADSSIILQKITSDFKDLENSKNIFLSTDIGKNFN